MDFSPFSPLFPNFAIALPTSGVAVLFAGSWRYEERTLASLARHLVRPLEATVLCALSGGGAGTSGSGALERQRMRKFFPALAGGETGWGGG